MSATTFDVLVEIPKGSRNKYEFDFKYKKIRFDRVLYSAMFYPAEYGFIPETYAEDNDPLDALVLTTQPTVPGCLIEVKPIAVFNMSDEKGPDEKIVCVPVDDPLWNKLENLSDINDHLVKEIEHFFKVYKDLENKKVEVGAWGDVKEALEKIATCQERFKGLDKEVIASYSLI
ncbi:inorganic diphosphatase [Zhouia sp. PK063]|uniref:inorganic diphosphatase n=1 Tax=Zhouia sp. PK063 TaxID=3373602 RepID=UPI003794A242